MKKKNYFIIIGYGFILGILFLGINHLYGSTVDWLSQHSVFPEYFRNLFYETGNLIPNFAFHLGGGQNIYNFSYYGLLSPIILISYFLPFIPMNIYIQLASFFLYLLSGVLMAKFIADNFKNETYGLVSGILMLSFSAVNFHFHHHIMFVWYFPFLIMALLGVSRYLEKKKSMLLMISLFLVIMTNYYYSVTALVVVFLYGIYKILDKEKQKFSDIVVEIFKLGVRFLIPIFMAMVILLPTLFCLKSGARAGGDSISFFRLFIPKFSEIFYQNSSLSLIGVFFIAIIGNLCVEHRKKSEIFFNVSLLLVLVFPIFMYLFNGRLYIRGKVLIPFLPLIIWAFISFLDSLFQGKIDLKRMVTFAVGVTFVVSILNIRNLVFLVDILISLKLICFVYQKKKKAFFVCFVIVVLILVSGVNNYLETYVSFEKYRDVNNVNVKKLFEEIDDSDLYRSLNTLNSKDTVNRVYTNHYYSPMVYSSTYNSRYWKFYHFFMGNNIKYRNILMATGSNNELFYTYMGVKYVVSKKDPGLYYEKIASRGGFHLYYNSSAYPVLYLSDQLGNRKELETLSFPYNVEYFMNRTVVSESGKTPSYETKIQEYEDPSFSKEYEFSLEKKSKKTIDLPDEFANQILYVSFDMLYDQDCRDGDTKIAINGIENKLTCREWKYHNQNKNFTYVIPLGNDPKIDIVVEKGKYKIRDIKMYFSEKIGNEKKEVNDLVVKQKDSMIKGRVDVDQDRYVVSSIPYDDGFHVYVDGKKVKNELVNEAFLGFPVSKGKHTILIKYESPGYREGILLSLFGFSCFFLLLGFELKKNCWHN